MSCYVINKQDYAKVGATLGAFTEIQSYYREPILYKYNFEKGKLSDWQDIQKDILKLFDINLKSVSESWNEDLKDTEEIDQTECIKYKEYIKKLWRKRQMDIRYQTEFDKVMFSIYQFFRSVSYQIDNRELNEQANNIIGKYSNYLLEIMRESKHIENDTSCWGAFELDIE